MNRGQSWFRNALASEIKKGAEEYRSQVRKGRILQCLLQFHTSGVELECSRMGTH